MKTKLKIACTLTLLSLVGNVVAAEIAPSSVEGIHATANGNSITVTWDAVTSDPIEYYRVYYSGESILDNNGLFDDFETTEGSETTLTFTAPTSLQEIYVAVIAVATSGMESEFFTEEARVEVGEPQNVPPVQVPSSSAKPTVGTSFSSSTPSTVSTEDVRLLKAEVTSPTEIVVTFSASMTVDQKRAPEGLTIEGPDGKMLQIKSITIDSKTITIKTEQQFRGMVYNVQFSEPFEGRSGQPLDASDRNALVTGHAEGKEPVQPDPVRISDPLSPPDIEDATLVPELQPNGAYTITMQWTVDNSPQDLYGIVVYQTRDGQTFGPPSMLPIDIGGLQLQNVTPGFFGLYIQTINVYGYVSPGVFQYANLPQYIPGYGFYGDLTFGSMNSNGEVLFDEVDDAADSGSTHLASIEVITDESPMQALEGVDHSAAAERVHMLNIKNAAILAGGSSIVIILMISAFIFIPRRLQSSDQ